MSEFLKHTDIAAIGRVLRHIDQSLAEPFKFLFDFLVRVIRPDIQIKPFNRSAAVNDISFFIVKDAVRETAPERIELIFQRQQRKPFPLPVLYEKVNALIKRSKGLVRSKVFSVDDLSLNPNNGIVVSGGEEVKLTAKEYAILKVLLENKGSVINRDKLIDMVWGYNSGADERLLDTHMRNLRKSLGSNGKLIKTVIRRGYKIEER